MKKWIALFFSSTFFTGFLPGKITGKPSRGGGLAGSLVALVIQILFIMNNISFAWMAGMIAVLFLIGIIAIRPAEKFILKRGEFQTKHGKKKMEDFNQTNIDEVIGQLIAGVPVLLAFKSLFIGLGWLFFAFTLFRIFDVLKPWPIWKVEEKIKGPLGIILDDVVAGAMAGLIVWIFLL